MEHKTDREYRYLVKYHLRGIISEDEFVSEYQDPDNYYPEAPSENLSGRHEGEGRYWEQKWGPLEDSQ